MTDFPSPYAMTQDEEMVELHAISCRCERCQQVRALERERNRPSVYFRSPEKPK